MPPKAAPSLDSKEQIPPRGWLRALGPGAGGVWVLLGAAGSAWAPPAPPALQREPVPTAAASWCVMLAHEMQAGAAVYQPKCSPNRGAINSWVRSLGRGKRALRGQILAAPCAEQRHPPAAGGHLCLRDHWCPGSGWLHGPSAGSQCAEQLCVCYSEQSPVLPPLASHSLSLPQEHLLLLLRPGGCLRGWLSS